MMPFPVDTKRAIYRRNTLDNVICQLRFPTILKIESALPVEFQELIRTDYPLFRQREDLPLPPFDLAPGVPLQQVFSAMQRKSAIYDFASDDESSTISLNANFVAFTTKHYLRWEGFRERVHQVIKALTQIYAPSFFTRVGLRYVNAVSKAALGLDKSVPWSDLFQPHILGPLNLPEITPHVQEHVGMNTIALLYQNARVRLQYAVAVDENGNPVFALDSDLFTEERTEVGDVFTTLDEFNTRAGRLFEWSITDKLRAAMEPESVA